MSRVAGDPNSRGAVRLQGRDESLNKEQKRMKSRSEKPHAMREGLLLSKL